MDRFKLMETYAAVVCSGSYASAARTLGVTRAMVSKRIQDLEDALRVKLLNRDTHRVSMTSTGADYYTSCVAILAEVNTVEEQIQVCRRTATGQLKILCSRTFGERILGPIVTDFCLLNPGISVQLTLLDRQLPNLGIDLISGGFDMAVRTRPVESSALIARPIARLPRILVASPDYIAAEGMPSTPVELASRSCLKPSGMVSNRWEFDDLKGCLSIRVSGRLTATSSVVIRRAALSGLGIARLGAYLVTEHLADGSLVKVLESFLMPERVVYVVYQRDRQRPLRTRLFVKFFLERMKEDRNLSKALRSPAKDFAIPELLELRGN